VGDAKPIHCSFARWTLRQATLLEDTVHLQLSDYHQGHDEHDQHGDHCRQA
jgi:hypothetical protein